MSLVIDPEKLTYPVANKVFQEVLVARRVCPNCGDHFLDSWICPSCKFDATEHARHNEIRRDGRARKRKLKASKQEQKAL